MTNLSSFTRLVSLDNGLSVLSSARDDGRIHSCVVNAGVLPHPVGGAEVVGLVSAGGTRKLQNLRADRRATIVVRAGWEWAGVEGTADLIGPDDPHGDVDAEALRKLLRDIFLAAGGSHDDWDTYDKVMVEERRAAVLITPRRTYGNTQTG